MQRWLKTIVVIGAVLSVSLSVIASVDSKQLGVSLDATWVSKYIWRGQDLYDDHAAFQPSINFDLYGTGLSLNFWASYAGSGGFRDAEEFDYSVAYRSSLFEGECRQIDYAVSWLYYDVYDAPTRDNDSQEFLLDLSWPEVFSAGLVPCYTLSYLTPARSGGGVADIGGYAHIMGFSYGLEVDGLKDDLSFSWDITYNDGQGADFDHDWSHITWGLSSTFGDAFGGTFTPAIYYQTTMDKSVNDEDEFWVGLSYGFNF